MDTPALAFSLGVLVLIIGAGFVFARAPGLRLTSAQQVSRLFLEDYWDAQIRGVALSRDGRTALLELEDGEIGLVSALGDRAVTRRLAPSAIKARADEDGLELRLPDASLFRLRLDLDDGEREQWARRLSAARPARGHEVEAA